MTFSTVDTLTVNTNWNVTALWQPVRQQQYSVYLRAFMIIQHIWNSYEYDLKCLMFEYFICGWYNSNFKKIMYTIHNLNNDSLMKYIRNLFNLQSVALVLYSYDTIF